jgi:hypothetical protein
MVRRRLRRTGATLAIAMLVAACSGASDETPEVADIEEVDASGGMEEAEDDASADAEGTEVAEDDVGADEPDHSTEPADDATETADGDPYAIPEDGIDEEYVERVLKALLDVNRAALTITLDSEPGGLVPFEAEERLRAIFGDKYGAAAYTALSEIASDVDRRAGFRDPPGAVGVSVIEVVEAERDCLTVMLEMDFSEVAAQTVSPRTEYLALSPRPQNDQDEYNPTPWVVADGDMAAAEGLSCS